MGILLSGATLYWRWLAIAGLCGALFSCGAVWEGKRAEKRLEAYQAVVEAAADKQAIHAGVIKLEGAKTLENVSGVLNDEINKIQGRYDAYGAAHPVAPASGVRQPAPATSASGVPAPAERVPGDAESPAGQRFIAALQRCEEIAQTLKAWQAWYSENTKNFKLP